MTKKSIGLFIATLRKAHGMTQKQLAEKLNVSDKSVSRWERDECAPDLSLIPVLAEIFQVTSDEILRGERKNPDTALPANHLEKTEKQILHLVNDTKTKFSIRSIISLSIGVLGLIAAMICNFGFNRAYIAFGISCIFYLAAFVCETVFTILAFSSIANEEFHTSKVNLYKRQMFSYATKTFSTIGIIFAISLPLVFLSWDAYTGITGYTWLTSGLITGAITIFLSWILSWWVASVAVQKKIYELSETETEKMLRINSLRKKYIIQLIIAVAITFFAQTIFNSCIDASFFSKGTVFKDLNEFKEYMETPVSWEDSMNLGNNSDLGFSYEIIPEEPLDSEIYYDEEGNEISKDEAFTEYIYTKDGKDILLSYVHLNESVVQISYQWTKNELTAITTYTFLDIAAGENIITFINAGWMMLYIIESALFLLFYYKKRKLISPI